MKTYQYETASLEFRILTKVNKNGPIPEEAQDLGPCWVWTGAHSKQGYGQIVIGKKNRQVHRVLYELMCGPIPDGYELDHLCYNKPCVNPTHLRVAEHCENAWNTPKRVNNTSGYKGVFKARCDGWMARITYRNKAIYLGYFKDKEEAYAAYCKAAKELFGEFAKLK